MSLERPVLCLLALVACGKDVDLGGSTDASIPDAGGSVVCEPCASSSECASGGTCAHLTASSAEGFCLRTCATATCDADDACTSTTSTTGETLRACVPKTGVCSPARPPPVQPDGAPLERCGDLVGPTVSAQCHACQAGSSTCQPNGCYGGYWCDTTIRRCQRPPACTP